MSYAPIKRNGQQTDEADNQLKMDPVLHKVSQQREEAHSGWPEVLDYGSRERTIFGSEQFTSHYLTWQNYPLTTTQVLTSLCTDIYDNSVINVTW